MSSSSISPGPQFPEPIQKLYYRVSPGVKKNDVTAPEPGLFCLLYLWSAGGVNVHFSYKNCQATPDVEHIIDRQVAKFARLLEVYNADMIHFKGSLTHGAGKGGQDFEASINLRLPTGQVHGRESSPDAVSALRVAFEEVERQLKQHKDLVRHEADWKKTR